MTGCARVQNGVSLRDAEKVDGIATGVAIQMPYLQTGSRNVRKRFCDALAAALALVAFHADRWFGEARPG